MDEWEGTRGDPDAWAAHLASQSSQHHQPSPVPGRGRRPPARRRARSTVLIVVMSMVFGVFFAHLSSRGAEDSFDFLERQQNSDAPVTYNHCVPLRLFVNPRTGPPDAVAVVEEAARRVSQASGFDLSVEGTTTLAPTTDNAGPGPGAVLVAWSDPQERPNLQGSVAGRGGSWRSLALVDGRYWYTRGQVTLDGPALLRLPRRYQVSTVMHELAHVIGLGHVDDERQLMDPSPQGTDWGPGDLAGLREMGSQPCPR